MRLAPRLVLAFGGLTALSTAGLGFTLREELRRDGSDRFGRDVAAACDSVKTEVIRQAESDRKLVAAACQSGELVDRVITWMESGELANQRVSLGTTLVPNERAAFDQDELTLVTGKGDILGADPLDILSRPRSELDAALHGGIGRFDLRTTAPVATVTRCLRTREGKVVGLVAARHLVPLLNRLRATLKVTSISIGSAQGETPPTLARAACVIADGSGAGVPIVVTKNKEELYATWAYIDRTVLFASAVLTGIALLLAVLIARSLGRPIAELAAEARKVASDQANPLRVRGSGEIAELVQAFDHMLEDLASTRRRLAATTRVAAWREVARRVAHEVKNPLAPIRAAVETLRRLRARDDPAFDEYFDEATRTVLGEVHRISNIVTEFTRFARLSPPRPEDLDLVQVMNDVVQLERPLAGSCVLEQVVVGQVPHVRADRDQIVQVLVNLVQNAIEASRETPSARVWVTVAVARPDAVDMTVEDNGPGVSKEIASRLFEPYATTKAEGTGLGLAIAQRIAIEHDGELAFLPRERGAGTGAIFRLRLPVCGPPVLADLPEPASSDRPA
jgi:two-component system nitrogen regulation sensor histidine kinase NtrY